MSILDILDMSLVGLGLAACIAWIRGARRAVIGLAVVLTVLVFDLLLAVLTVLGQRRTWAPSAWERRAIVVLMLGIIAPWLIAPAAPNLPAPSGPYPVGSQTFRWVDPTRLETATADPRDHRNVVAQIWYPAARAAGPHTVYMDGLRDLPPMVSIIPGFAMRGYGRIETHATQYTPVSAARAWPVVAFSPGYGATRSAYSGLLADLASRGYVVVAIDHPYEAAVVQLADGRIVTPADAAAPVIDTDAHQEAWMSGQLDIRAGDLRFALDQVLAGPLAPQLDAGRIVAIGHSFGGATAIVAADRDPRVRAAANIDGTLYGDIAGRRLTQPLLLIQSDHAETGHGQRFIEGNRRLFAGRAGPGWGFEIKRANHYSFTDAPFYLTPPTRWVLSRVIGGERGPLQTQRATNDILGAFMKRAFGGADDPAAAARRSQGIVPVQGMPLTSP